MFTTVTYHELFDSSLCKVTVPSIVILFYNLSVSSQIFRVSYYKSWQSHGHLFDNSINIG